VAISSFADDPTEDIYNGVDSRKARKILKGIWSVAVRTLDMVNAAHDVLDLKAPPGNRLEKLKGDLAGKYSIRVNDQYRIVFAFANGNASEVQITDYH
jgi:toxin HigB-1